METTLTAYDVYIFHVTFGDSEFTIDFLQLKPFKDGFWVDADFKYSYDNDRKYWIPPHAVKFVEIEHRTI
jgi:hypothetical protein